MASPTTAVAVLGRNPDFVARAPGRVNLIGEHTDYNGLPVLPMAIDRSITVTGCRRDDDVVTMVNARSSFGPRRFRISSQIEPFAAGDWGNYAKAAAQGLRLHLGQDFARGADLFVEGDIPDGAGLSSSASLVVASAMALLAANDTELPFSDLAPLLARAEQYVGTLSGGMDQTVSLLARADHALRIDFEPLRHRTVPLPPDHAFVVAHSLVHADKAGTARRAYNLRVAECRLAAWATSRLLNLTRPDGTSPRHLGDVRKAAPSASTADLVATLAAALPPGAQSLEAVAARFRTDVASMQRAVELPADVGDEFVLLARARHVWREADRVDTAEAALRRGDTEAFAAAMRASHASCRDDYGISCPEVEALVQAAEQAGATAARITGAGFGGCVVALVRREAASEFLQRLDAAFYGPRDIAKAVLPDLRFVLSAAAGASVERRT